MGVRQRSGLPGLVGRRGAEIRLLSAHRTLWQGLQALARCRTKTANGSRILRPRTPSSAEKPTEHEPHYLMRCSRFGLAPSILA